MPFTPRTFEQILDDMVAYMQANTSISDYNVGSVIRTILEAAALEDDEQYFQMVQLLDLFSFTTAAGEDLDRRLADFGLTRRAAVPATVKLKFYDSSLIRTAAGQDYPASALTITGADTTRFPTSGYPYTIRVGEGTTRLQNLAVLNNNTVTGDLTLASSTVFDVFIGDRIAFVTGGTLSAPVPPSASARTINIGQQVQAAPTVTELVKIYSTIEPAFIIQGNYESNEVIAKCTVSGTAGNVGAGRINQFLGSPPFIGAGVFSISQAAGGLDRETDTEFRTRALSQLQSLSRGTPLALKSAAIGVFDPISQSKVTSANLVEDFTNDEVIVYVDDGTGAAAKTNALPSGSLAAATLAGDSAVQPVSLNFWPDSGWLFIDDGANSELVQFISNDGFILTTGTPLVYPHAASTVVNFVDLISASAEATQRRFQTTNYPVVRNTERIWLRAPTGAWTLLTRNVDYILNRGTGQIQLTDVGGVVAGTAIVAHYIYYTNLIAEVQKVLEGDLTDYTRYPGVKAAGIFLSVEQPVVKRISVIASITAAEGYSEINLAPNVKRAIESYISSLRIGQDVITSKIVDSAFSVVGLADIRVVTPTANIILLESELPVPFDASGDSLVQVL